GMRRTSELNASSTRRISCRVRIIGSPLANRNKVLMAEQRSHQPLAGALPRLERRGHACFAGGRLRLGDPEQLNLFLQKLLASRKLLRGWPARQHLLKGRRYERFVVAHLL